MRAHESTDLGLGRAHPARIYNYWLGGKDNYKVVLVHARALLTSTPEGSTDYLDADLRDVGDILERAGQTLDFGRPVAVTLIAILHLVPDDDAVHRILTELTAPLCPGSALALSVVTGDSDPLGARAAQEAAAKHGLTVTLRSKAEAEAMFTGLYLTEPGVTLVHRWHPKPGDPQLADSDVHVWGGVAVKPAAAGSVPLQAANAYDQEAREWPPAELAG